MERNACPFVTHAAATAGTVLPLPRYDQAPDGLLYLHRGEVELQGEDGSSTVLREKEALLLRLGPERQLRVREDAAWMLCAIRCGRELPEFRTAGLGPVRSCRELPGADTLLPQLDSLFFGLGQRQAAKLPVRLFLSLADRGGPAEREAPAHLQAMRRMIDACYQEDLTLEDLALRVGRSKFHLSRAFQELYHVTPGEYLTGVRLSHAARLLADTDLPVGEIGRSVGILNSAYFTALFKRQYGRPPRAYRMWSRSAKKAD